MNEEIAEVCGDRDQHVGVHVRRVEPGLGQVVGAVERLGARLDRQHTAARADPRLADPVVRLCGRLLHLAVGVVVGGVEGGRVVLVVVEVPAGDVVDVTVAVVVDPIRVADDQVLGVDQPVAVGVPGVGVVAGAERAVAFRRGRPRQLAGVEEDPVGELLGVVVPVDAALDVGDHRAGVAGGEALPGPVDEHPGRALGVGRVGGALRDERVEVVLLVLARLGRADLRPPLLGGCVGGVVWRIVGECRQRGSPQGQRRRNRQRRGPGQHAGPPNPSHLAHSGQT